MTLASMLPMTLAHTVIHHLTSDSNKKPYAVPYGTVSHSSNVKLALDGLSMSHTVHLPLNTNNKLSCRSQAARCFMSTLSAVSFNSTMSPPSSQHQQQLASTVQYLDCSLLLLVTSAPHLSVHTIKFRSVFSRWWLRSRYCCSMLCGLGQVQKAIANPHFKAHLFQHTRQGVHSLCLVNYAPWQ